MGNGISRKNEKVLDMNVMRLYYVLVKNMEVRQ